MLPPAELEAEELWRKISDYIMRPIYCQYNVFSFQKKVTVTFSCLQVICFCDFACLLCLALQLFLCFSDLFWNEISKDLWFSVISITICLVN